MSESVSLKPYYELQIFSHETEDWETDGLCYFDEAEALNRYQAAKKAEKPHSVRLVKFTPTLIKTELMDLSPSVGEG